MSIIVWLTGSQVRQSHVWLRDTGRKHVELQKGWRYSNHRQAWPRGRMVFRDLRGTKWVLPDWICYPHEGGMSVMLLILYSFISCWIEWQQCFLLVSWYIHPTYPPLPLQDPTAPKPNLVNAASFSGPHSGDESSPVISRKRSGSTRSTKSEKSEYGGGTYSMMEFAMHNFRHGQ